MKRSFLESLLELTTSQVNAVHAYGYSVFSEASIIFEGRMDRRGHNQNPPTGSVGSADQLPFGFIQCQPNQITEAGVPLSVVRSVGGMQATGQPAGAQLGPQQQHNQNPPMGVVGSVNQWPLGFMAFQPYQIMTRAPGSVGTPLGGMQSIGQPDGAQLGQHQLAYQRIHQQQLQAYWAYQMNGSSRSAVTSFGGMQSTGQLVGAQPGQHQLAYQHIQQLQQQLQAFWANQNQEVKKVTDFKKHSLPLARIKKIMKADQDVRMVSDDAPVLLAKACELFISELTMRSRNHSKTGTLQKNDIVAAVAGTNTFDFLVDILPDKKMTDYPPAETADDSLPVSPAFQIIEADEDIKEENYD